MAAYGTIFARVYDLLWPEFAQRAAPRLLEYYARTPLGQTNHTLLDLGCGTGQLALHFLQQGYRVTGLDLSEAMLEQARDHTLPYIDNGQARFIQGDAAVFRMAERFGLVVSTYDALNHLPSYDELCWCFRSVWNVLEEGGTFIFDLNTRAGLYERWNGIAVQETEDAIVITRGIYDGVGDRATIRATGCVRLPDGHYERFAETMFNTVFDLRAVRSALLELGWSRVHFARLSDLDTPLTEPEREGRVWLVAGR